MFTRKISHGIQYYSSPLFDSYNIKHMFCTRYGGVSTGAFDSLNFSTSRKDKDGQPDKVENVEENYKRVCTSLGISLNELCSSKQIHSDIIKEVSENDGGKGVLSKSGEFDGCDGLILKNTTKNIRGICVKTADCVPVLLANIKTGDVCAVHAGWRGSVSDIVSKACQKLSYGKSENIIAAIGPCIGACCYEVGEEVYNAASLLILSKDTSFDLSKIFIKRSINGQNKLNFDLAEFNKSLLLYCGMKKENIDVSGICTCDFKDNDGLYPFFSHRGSLGHSGTFLSIILK